MKKYNLTILTEMWISQAAFAISINRLHELKLIYKPVFVIGPPCCKLAGLKCGPAAAHALSVLAISCTCQPR